MNARRQINEAADKLKLRAKVVRGTDTRDQETIKVEVRGNDPAETVEQLDATLRELEDTADYVRGIQP